MSQPIVDVDANGRVVEVKEETGPPPNLALEKFHQIESNFNLHFMEFLWRVMGMAKSPEESVETLDEMDREQYDRLLDAYYKWHAKVDIDSGGDPQNDEAVRHYYQVFDNVHELLLARDEQLLKNDEIGDLFSAIFDQPGINTIYLYHLLPDPESEEDADPKSALWDAMIGMYRLSVLICIYKQMPIVKEIINMILLNNPDIHQGNIFEKIYGEFNKSARMKKLVFQLMKTKGDQFGEIFTSLQRVIATFNGEVGGAADMTNVQANMEAMKQRVHKAFDEVLKESQVDIPDVTKQELLSALADKNDEALSKMVRRGAVSAEQLETIQKNYQQRGLDKVNVNKMVQDLGDTMNKFMGIMNIKDEAEQKAAMEKLVAESGSMMGVNPEELQRFQTEMEEMDRQWAEEHPEDEAEEEDVDSNA